MDTQFILLWFEAPLQSWGFDSKFGRRDTLAFPTKSGVLGLLLSAMGRSGEQKELLKEFSTLTQTVISFVRSKVNNDHTDRLDRQPLLRDFQMVGSGYDDQNPWQSLLIPKTVDYKKAVGGGSKLTYRYYMQDAAFAVALEVLSENVGIIAESLKNPNWDIFLGRKNCVPTEFVFQGKFLTQEAAIEHAMKISSSKQRVEEFRVIDGFLNETAHETLTLNDVPIQFGIDKRYRDRQVSLIYAR